MTTRVLLGLAFSTCLVACFAKTTSLGGPNDTDGGAGGSGGGRDLVSNDAGTSGNDAGTNGNDAGTNGSGIACQIADPMLPVAPCPAGEYCKSNDGTCGGVARCVTRPPPPPPFCPDLECDCSGNVRCRDTSRSSGTDVGPTSTCGITCGTKTCNGVTEYCWHGTGGVMFPDGGANSQYKCNAIPTACRIDHSCACLLANGGPGKCTETGGKLDLDVPLP